MGHYPLRIEVKVWQKKQQKGGINSSANNQSSTQVKHADNDTNKPTLRPKQSHNLKILYNSNENCCNFCKTDLFLWWFSQKLPFAWISNNITSNNNTINATVRIHEWMRTGDSNYLAQAFIWMTVPIVGELRVARSVSSMRCGKLEKMVITSQVGSRHPGEDIKNINLFIGTL